MNLPQAVKVLVIDDSKDDQELCARALSSAFGDRLTLTVAPNGERGLDAIQQAKQDCVLLDYSLPGHNGIEVLGRIRSLLPYLPIILLTGHGSEAIAAQSIKAGAQDYITKHDITPDLLSRAIRAAVENGAQQERLDEQNIMLAQTNATLARLMTDLAGSRDRAQQADRAKSRFLAGMSHELRTPLNGIMGYAHLLRLEGGLNARQSGRVEAMLSAGDHLLTIISSVLDMYEVESEHVTLHPSQIDLCDLAASCLNIVGAAAETKGLALGLTTVGDPPLLITTDATRLRQVLLNLLGNAIKFTPTGKIELALRAKSGGTGMRIEVSDTGPGIPAELRARLFQDFSREDTPETCAIEGSGLGLALAARLAKLLDGRIGHEDNPGGGSLFWLELPSAIEGIIAKHEIVSVRPEMPNPIPRLRILVVDDVEMNREIATAFLKDMHEITCVNGGAEAVAEAASAVYDVILMDVRMPGVDGLEATRRIRCLDGRSGQVPVVGMTAQAFAEQVAACRKAGMDAHVSKPFTPDVLRQAVIHAAAAGHLPAGGRALRN